VTLSNNTVQSNYVQDSSAFGGGLYVARGTVTLTSDSVESNSLNSGIVGTVSSYGGGLYVAGGTVTLTSDSVESNSADSGGIGTLSGHGGGLYVAGGTVTLASDTVESDVASGTYSSAGGIYIATAATVYVDPFTLAHVINNTAAIDPNIDGSYITS
jgi:hypothetical protein